jgi:predicted nucleic acid-binding Zn ribbon protein
MYGRFQHLSAFGKKFLEVCGAGLASAVVACLLGQTDKAEAPLAPVVYLAPADAQMMKLMHDDQSALLERLRTPAETVPAPAIAANDTPAAAPAVAPVPAPQAAPTRRDVKPSRTAALAMAKRQPEDLPAVTVGTSIASSNAASSVLPPPAAVAPQPVARQNIESANSPVVSAVEEATDWVSSLKQIPGWFWPAGGGGLVSAAPRPPMPVGNFMPHMM